MADRPGPIRIRLIAAALLLLATSAALLWAGTRWAQAQADAAADTTASQTARNHAGLLASELQKFRLLPLVLVEYPDVSTALATHAPAAVARLNRTLELLADRTDAAVIYVIDADGLTVAASNWRLPTSFVGQNYSFRPYFRDAMARGASELFALGTISGRPGLFLARRLEVGGRAAGTVVVKVEFDRLEATWARAAGPSFVTDAHGVILITSVPDWRFRTTHPLDAATLAQARATLQFGSGPPRAAPIALSGGSATAPLAGGTAQYRVASLPVPLAGSRLIHLEPLAAPLGAATTRVRLWGLAILIILGAIAGLTWRAREKRHLQREAQAALEQEVARRTAELSETNRQLTIESRERIEAERRFRAAREELAQANRLGSLGQITAGVAHEINQPVAAIRTFAENAETFLDRDQIGPVRGNLAQIIDLTARIGSITAELRTFARRRTPARGAIGLGSVVDGALLILGERAREIVTVDLPPVMRDTRVAGDRVRLEQIVVNLLQNALDAVEGVARPRILIAAAASGNDVTVTVGDNGRGVDPAIADQLFAPFVSAKPEGLGLGLAIARDIAREFGGELEIGTSALDGAAFLLKLKRA
ncbi:MAG: ATP-binding protein [Candidatus Sphingomonas phytovorans]|nr:ATP-binding protein [Sphingomonas sp.]WEJ99370.1 MAG: ATP-binding protein [Sphingomonas sp.]